MLEIRYLLHSCNRWQSFSPSLYLKDNWCSVDNYFIMIFNSIINSLWYLSTIRHPRSLLCLTHFPSTCIPSILAYYLDKFLPTLQIDIICTTIHIAPQDSLLRSRFKWLIGKLMLYSRPLTFSCSCWCHPTTPLALIGVEIELSLSEDLLCLPSEHQIISK